MAEESTELKREVHSDLRHLDAVTHELGERIDSVRRFSPLRLVKTYPVASAASVAGVAIVVALLGWRGKATRRARKRSVAARAARARSMRRSRQGNPRRRPVV